jgi:hypothetical protein
MKNRADMLRVKLSSAEVVTSDAHLSGLPGVTLL